MSDPAKERNYIVGLYLSQDDLQPRFRHVYRDMQVARQDVSQWFSQGYIDINTGDYQDHYAPSQLYKVRFLPVTKIVTSPCSAEADELGINDEEAYWLDASGNIIDPQKVPM